MNASEPSPPYLMPGPPYIPKLGRIGSQDTMSFIGTVLFIRPYFTIFLSGFISTSSLLKFKYRMMKKISKPTKTAAGASFPNGMLRKNWITITTVIIPINKMNKKDIHELIQSLSLKIIEFNLYQVLC